MRQKKMFSEKVLDLGQRCASRMRIVLFFALVLSMAMPSVMAQQEENADCAPVSAPFAAEFRGDSATAWNARGILPQCWQSHFFGTDSAFAPHIAVDSSLMANAILLSAGREATIGTMVNLLVPMLSNHYQDLSITFHTRMENVAHGRLSFGYWYDFEDITYFMSLENIPATDTLATHTFDLSRYAIPDGCHLAFSWSNNDSCARCMLYGVELDSLQLCLVPTITAAKVLSDTEIRIEWQKGWSESSWIVEYGQTGFEHGSGTIQVVEEPYLAVSNLAAGTVYDCYVKAICDGDSTSEWTPVVSVMTPCTAMTIPFAEDFQSYSASAPNVAGVLPDCWQVISTANVANRPHVSYYPEQAQSTHRALALMSANKSGFATSNIVCLPWFSSDLNGLRLGFSAKMDRAQSDILTLGYVTNVLDASSFVVLEDIPNTTTATSYSRSLAGKGIPEGARLAFRWTSNMTAWDMRCVIDDVTLDFLPCQPVSNVQVSDVMMTSAHISWAPSNEEREWMVEYGPAGYNHDSTAVSVIVRDTFADLTNLVGNQPLDIYVKALCDPLNHSDYSEVVSFTPYCSVYGDTTVAEACDSFVWHDSSYTATGIYIDTLFQAAEFACDSICILNLTINYSSTEFDTLAICQNELPIVWRDTTFEMGSTDSSYIFYRTRENGCDSTIHLAVIVYPSFYQDEYDTICQQALPYTWRDTTFEVGTETNDFIFNRISEFGCDSIVTFHLVVNESYYQTEYQQICKQELPFTWRDTTFEIGTESGIFTLNRETEQGCDSIVTFVLVVKPSYDEAETLTLCRNELPYTWGDTTFAADAQSGVVTFRGQTAAGCDSVVTLNLVIGESSLTEDNVEICESELPYVWRDQILPVGTTSGDYTYQRVSATGCDSTAILHLTVRPTFHNEYQLAICASELPYTFGDTTFAVGTTTKSVVRHLTTQYGCDSVEIIYLTVNRSSSFADAVDVCRNDFPYTYYDTTFMPGTPSGVYILHRQNAAGCDSVITLTLNVRLPYSNTESLVVCENELPVVWHNQVIDRGMTSGNYTFHNYTQYGCDSTVTLRLVVYPSYRQNVELSICENELPYTWRDTVFEVGSRGGNYLFEKHTAFGCDSVVVLKLTVNPSFERDENITICSSDLPYTYEDNVFPVGTQSGDYQMRRTTPFGCEDVVNLHLTINPVAESDDYITLCAYELPFTYQGTTFPVGTTTLNRDFNLRTVNGCDSLVHLHLTINAVANTEESITICASDLPYYYAAFDTTFLAGTVSRDYVFHRTNLAGCEDVATLHLTVNPTFNYTTSQIICQNELPYTWRDTTFQVGTQSGVYQFSRTTVDGCDSLVSLALIVYPSYAQYEVEEVCVNAFPFTWRDTTFQQGTAAGDYTFYRQTINGCDSIVTLTLIIHPVYSENLSLAICESELPYTWRDVTFQTGTISGIYTYNRESEFGCDSIVTLVLTVRPTFAQTFNVQICENDLPYYYTQTDTTFEEGTTSGTYRFVYTNTYGCDSVVVLNLSVYPYYEDEESLTICSSDLPYYYERENRTFQIGTTSGDYPFHHYTAHGCDSLWTLHLTVNQSYTQTQQLRICENELPYVWNDTIFDEGTLSGSFTFYRTTAAGCDSIVTLTLFVYQQPNVSIAGANTMELGTTEMLVAQASACTFVWSTGEESSAIYITPDSAGVFTYTVTATHNSTHCSNTATHIVLVNDTVGIATYTIDAQVSLFPNPTEGMVNVQSDNVVISEIEVYNMMGKLVRRENVSEHTAVLDLSDTAPGTYILQMKLMSGDVVRKKLIVK